MKIRMREEEELKNLTKAQISADIDASDATRRTALLTAILVAVTIFYAMAAWATWREMIRTRKESRKPLVTGKIVPLGVSAVVLQMVNIGLGAARNIEVEYKVLPKGPTGSWSYHLLQSDDLVRIKIPVEMGIQKFVEEYTRVIVESKFEDIFGKIWEDRFTIDLTGFDKTLKNNLWIWDTSLREDIEAIPKNLKELVDLLKQKRVGVRIDGIDMSVDINKLKADIALFESLKKRHKKTMSELSRKKKADKPSKK